MGGHGWWEAVLVPNYALLWWILVGDWRRFCVVVGSWFFPWFLLIYSQPALVLKTVILICGLVRKSCFWCVWGEVGCKDIDVARQPTMCAFVGKFVI